MVTLSGALWLVEPDVERHVRLLKDSQNNAGTFFLSEAQRRKYSYESVTEWVIREGFEWLMETLETRMSDLRGLSRDLQSPAVMEHFDMRTAALLKKVMIFQND